MNTVFTIGPTFNICHIVSVWEQPPCESCKPSAASPAAACAESGEQSGHSRTTGPADVPMYQQIVDAHNKMNTPAVDLPDVPSWVDDIDPDTAIGLLVMPCSTRNLAMGIAALRASRDHWRERAEELREQVRNLGSVCQDLTADRLDHQRTIRDLEARVARQIATIDELQRRNKNQSISIAVLHAEIGTAVACFCDPAACQRDPAAAKFRVKWSHCLQANHPAKPESSCDCGKIEHGRHHMNCPAISTIPTPPPEGNR